MASSRAEFAELRRRIDDGVLVLFALVAEGIGWATSALLDQDVERAEQVIADDHGIDERCAELAAFVRDGLAAAAVDPNDLEYFIGVLQIIPELERSADLVEHVARFATQHLGGVITPTARGVIQSMSEIARRMWQMSSEAYRHLSRDIVFTLKDADDELDALASQLVREGATEGTDPRIAADLALLARFYERIGDHAVNLARRVDSLAAPRRLARGWPLRSSNGKKAPREKKGRLTRSLHSVSRFKLVPTDEGFFDLFESAAANVRDCSEALAKLIAADDAGEYYDALTGFERLGDEITRTMLSRLDASFVTPFDREDIHQLAEEIDDVVDDMFGTASLVQLIGAEPQPPELGELADVLISMADVMLALIGCLRTRDGARLRLERIETLERQGDVVYRRGMGRLFNGTYDPLYVIKWKDVLEAIEKALNAIEDVSDVVESMLVKNG